LTIASSTVRSSRIWKKFAATRTTVKRPNASRPSSRAAATDASTPSATLP
jgi:hypothetical protein